MTNQNTNTTLKSDLNEAKILLVGQGGVGKTSIIKRLTGSSFDLAESKTAGIQIQPWSVSIKKKRYKLNIWDFGGQEIMHATHQFFLTERSLYILVIDTRMGERENGLEYWLKIIESFGGDSPIIVVGNKIDQHQLDIDKRGLKAKYKNITTIVETSCKNSQGIDELRDVLTAATIKLPHIHKKISQNWLSVRTKIEKSKESFINFSRFENICINEAVVNSEEQLTLLSFLHDLGIVFHYKDDPRLEDTNILNPNWVTNGVYDILNSRLLAKSKGILHVNQLHQILNRAEYPKHTHFFIIDMMRKFEPCLSV
ncbi:MAG: GTP-binding protein [Lentisphaerae bacterium]|nr:GTP-binding protein [Lentisphaerota bacterium]